MHCDPLPPSYYILKNCLFVTFASWMTAEREREVDREGESERAGQSQRVVQEKPYTAFSSVYLFLTTSSGHLAYQMKLTLMLLNFTPVASPLCNPARCIK